MLLTDFGVSAQGIPIDFVKKVRRRVRLYQTRDRDDIERVLGPRHRDFELVGQQVARAHLPPDLAFLTLVESHFREGEMSPDDNAGLWQFTQDTARRYGLKVNEKVDERLDSLKSTQAACRYLLRLRHELGQECSLILVLAAYNMGPGRLSCEPGKLKISQNGVISGISIEHTFCPPSLEIILPASWQPFSLAVPQNVLALKPQLQAAKRPPPLRSSSVDSLY